MNVFEGVKTRSGVLLDGEEYKLLLRTKTLWIKAAIIYMYKHIHPYCRGSKFKLQCSFVCLLFKEDVQKTGGTAGGVDRDGCKREKGHSHKPRHCFVYMDLKLSNLHFSLL